MYMEFIESVIKFILDKWDELSANEKDRLRPELISTFISFVSEGEQCNKQVIGIHLK